MSKRREMDFYPTPSWATQELLNRVSIRGEVLECCAGDGAISQILDTSPHVDLTTNDIDLTRKVTFAFDAAIPESWQLWNSLGAIDWVVTNPPFCVAPQIIPLAFEYTHEGIAMLLRGSYTEPTFDRQGWLAEHAENLSDIIYLPRISFTGDGKMDSVSCNWYVWRKNHTGGCRVHWVCKPQKVRVPPLTTSFSPHTETPT